MAGSKNRIQVTAITSKALRSAVINHNAASRGVYPPGSFKARVNQPPRGPCVHFGLAPWILKITPSVITLLHQFACLDGLWDMRRSEKRKTLFGERLELTTKTHGRTVSTPREVRRRAVDNGASKEHMASRTYASNIRASDDLNVDDGATVDCRASKACEQNLVSHLHVSTTYRVGPWR